MKKQRGGTYVSDDENNDIALNATYSHSVDGKESSSYRVTLATPTKKKRCYAMIGDKVLASVQLSEQEDILDEDELIYVENIAVYRLIENGLEELYTISRIVESNEKELKNFAIKRVMDELFTRQGITAMRLMELSLY